MKIKYTGIKDIPDSVYEEIWEDEERDSTWEELSDTDKANFVKKVEEDSGYEFIIDGTGELTITEVII